MRRCQPYGLHFCRAGECGQPFAEPDPDPLLDEVVRRIDAGATVAGAVLSAVEDEEADRRAPRF